MRVSFMIAAWLVMLLGSALGEESAVPRHDLSKAKPSRFDVHENDLSDAGVAVIRPQYNIRLDPEYRGPWVTVGDVTGDGVAEIVSAKADGPGDVHYTTAVVVHRLDGSLLWKWGDPGTRNKIWHDVACQIHDLDGDGRNEVVVAADRRVIVFDGATGKQKLEFPIPEKASDCIVFCNVSGNTRATDILVKTRYDQIWVHDATGRLLWTVEKPGGYRTSHQPFPIDLDGDGRDELMAGYAMLNSDGTVRWTIPSMDGKLGGHADAIRLFQDGPKAEDKRFVVTHCGGNRITMLDGNGKVRWYDTGLHFESVFFGRLDPSLPGRQIVVDICHQPWGKAPLVILDEQGKLLGRYTTARSRQHRLVDWFGTGMDLIAYAQGRMLLSAKGKMVARFDTPSPGGEPPAVQGDKPVSYMVHLADVNGDQRPDVVLSTVPGAVVWVYVNEKGPKGLDPARLIMPANATLY